MGFLRDQLYPIHYILTFLPKYDLSPTQGKRKGKKKEHEHEQVTGAVPF